jgi:hypothetical protein
MKKLSILFMACFALYVTSFAQSFEGILVMDMTAQGMSITQEYKVKGEKAVVELKMGGIPVQRMFMDGEKKEMYMLMEKDQKIAMKLKTDDASKNEEKNKPKVTVTKETKDILGYKCTKIIVENDKKFTTAWMCKDLNLDFSKLGASGKKGSNNAILAKYGFPLELEGKDEKGTVTMKATKIEKTTIDSSVFPDLSQYEVQDMPSMGK